MEVKLNELVNKLKFRYPALTDFEGKETKFEEIDIIVFFKSSEEKFMGELIYAQISFYILDDLLVSDVNISEDNDDNIENSIKRNLSTTNIEELYNFVESFIDTCEKLKVLEENKYKFLDN